MYFRGLVHILLFLPGCTRRSLSIDDVQQQHRALANGLGVSAEAREMLIPGDARMGTLRLARPQADGLRERSGQDGRRGGHLEPHPAVPRLRFGSRRAEVALQAASVPKEEGVLLVLLLLLLFLLLWLLLLLWLSSLLSLSRKEASSSSTPSTPDFASAVAIIWDVDGTLADTTALGFTSTNAVLEEAGLPTITIEQYLHGCRYTTPQRLAWHATGNVDDVCGEELGAAFDRYYIALVDTTTAGFFPGMKQLVGKIGSIKPQAVLSNAASEYARKVCDANGVSRHMSRVAGADEVPAAKPSPMGLLQFCSDMGWQPNDVVYVGDSPSDGVAAAAAGMMSVGCTWGGHDVAAQRGKFDALVDTVDELAVLLGV